MKTRSEFQSLFSDPTQAGTFETQVLPACAVAVRDKTAEPTSEYWQFLASQVDRRGQ